VWTAREFQRVLFLLSFLHKRKWIFKVTSVFTFGVDRSRLLSLFVSCPTAGPYFNFPGRSPSRTRTLFVRQSFHNHWMDFFVRSIRNLDTKVSQTKKSLSRRIDSINQLFFSFFSALTQLGPNQKFSSNQKIQREIKNSPSLSDISCATFENGRFKSVGEEKQPGGRVSIKQGGRERERQYTPTNRK
jgi:hypothetical protein